MNLESNNCESANLRDFDLDALLCSKQLLQIYKDNTQIEYMYVLLFIC